MSEKVVVIVNRHNSLNSESMGNPKIHQSNQTCRPNTHRVLSGCSHKSVHLNNNNNNDLTRRQLIRSRWHAHVNCSATPSSYCRVLGASYFQVKTRSTHRKHHVAEGGHPDRACRRHRMVSIAHGTLVSGKCGPRVLDTFGANMFERGARV